MGVRRSDPVEDRKRALMRQGDSQSSKYGIGGTEKKGAYAPRKPSLPKMPWDEEEDMGARDLRDAFNEVSKPAAVCIKALLEYEQANDTEWQVLYFSGNYADGTGFAIKSDRIRPNGDVNEFARATAARLLEQKGST